VMEERVPSVKRGDWVLVEDAARCEGRVVVVIGVTAVIWVPRKDAVGDTYRAAEVRCCRPWVEAMLTSGRTGTGPGRAEQIPPRDASTRARVIAAGSASAPVSA